MNIDSQIKKNTKIWKISQVNCFKRRRENVKIVEEGGKKTK